MAHEMVPQGTQDVQADHLVEDRADSAMDVAELFAQGLVRGYRRWNVQAGEWEDDSAPTRKHRQQAEHWLHDQECVQPDMRASRQDVLP